MVLSLVIAISVLVSIVFAMGNGNLESLVIAWTQGAAEAISLCIGLCGVICLWSAVIELMRQSGLAEKLSRLLRPVLGRLFPTAAKDSETMEALSQNVSANLLGLGNAATPAGIRAATLMQKLSGQSHASNELCLLVVMNTASIQLLPTTVAALRTSLGASAPYDILPAVWLTSFMSVGAGIFAAKLFEKFSSP